MEFIIVDSTDVEEASIFYYNRYHNLVNPPGYNLAKWINLNCPALSADSITCYNLLDLFAETTSQLNKYFWRHHTWIVRTDQNQTYHPTPHRAGIVHDTTNIAPDLRVANISTSLDDFLGFLMFKDVLLNQTFPSDYETNKLYVFYGLQATSFSEKAQIQEFLPVSKESLSFLSCYGVSREKSSKMFLSPFSSEVWIGIGLGIISLSIVLSMNVLPAQNLFWVIVDNLVTMIAIPLEISLLGLPLARKKSLLLRSLMFTWVLSSIVLTAYYKTFFTSDITLPYGRIPSWRNVYDLHGFKFLLQTEYISQASNRNISAEPTSITDFGFAYGLLDYSGYSGTVKELLGYKSISGYLIGCDPYYYWHMDRDQFHVLNRTTCSKEWCDIPDPEENDGVKKMSYQFAPVWRSVRYSKPQDFVQSLASCSDKVAYLDKVEHIETLLPYLNDNADQRVYLKGSDGFLETVKGFSDDDVGHVVRNDFVWERLKVLLRSGILQYWMDWFGRKRPDKLFPFYANWSYPVVEARDKIDFNSKIQTIFVVWISCMVGCGVGFLVELIFSVHTSRLK
ncbi:hypothetical protein Fcan01_21028 [Folsomia candida]|uniref:Uncharacterized protein n=1 Tax=Folsomia candida TaxID=158441 RepID=A0A226DFM3_FOLCA|nr:hypothetical protein Fcan01_21028 [Folsomia candida]